MSEVNNDSPKELRVYDRSRVTTDWQCPRKRWWQYEFGGTGIVNNSSSLELFAGTTLHDGLAAIAQGVDIDEIAKAAKKQMFDALSAAMVNELEDVEFANEQSTLVEGLLRGFYKFVWPRIQEEYPEILWIEKEMEYEHQGLVFMSKPDLVVRSKEGEIVYIEYKSTSSKKEGWVNSWATAVQLHSTIKAVEATTGEKVDKVIVQGLYKGFESYGKQSSPFCYGYFRNGNPPFSQDSIQYEFKAGHRRVPTWEMEGGVEGWIDGMPEEVLGAQFPQVPPIFVNYDLVDRFFQQRAYREHEIKLSSQMINEIGDEGAIHGLMDGSFPQRFDQCHPYFGRSCSYVQLCHGSVDDPFQSGFVHREPHHQREIDQWKKIGMIQLADVMNVEESTA